MIEIHKLIQFSTFDQVLLLTSFTENNNLV